MDEKFEIYEVFIKQSYNVYNYKWKKYRIIRQYEIETVKDKYRYIMAKNEEEAVKFYKERYEWDFDTCIDFWKKYECKNYISSSPNYQNEVIANLTHPCFDELRKTIRAEDFLTYCRQEMYPLEIIMK